MDNVTIIGADDPTEPEPKGPGRVWMIVGILGGIAVGLLIATGAQLRSPEANTVPSSIPPVASPDTVPTTTPILEPSRLDILVDEYDGTLLLTGFSNSQSKLWRWESQTGTPLSLDMPGPAVLTAFNSSQVRLAAETLSAVSPDLVLWVGTPGNLEPFAVDATSFAWHISDPGRISWIEDLGTADPESIQLRTAILPSGGDVVIPISEAGRLVRFDDNGVLLEAVTEEEGFVLWRVEFEEQEGGRLQGRFLGTLPNGRILTSQGGELVSVGANLTYPQPFEFPSDKRMDAIATSPAGDRWAIWEIEEVTGVSAPAQLWILENEEIVFETTLPSALRAVSWSYDGRWLITAVGEPSPLSGFSSGTLWFIDTEDGSMHQVEAPGFVSAIAAVP